MQKKHLQTLVKESWNVLFSSQTQIWVQQSTRLYPPTAAATHRAQPHASYSLQQPTASYRLQPPTAYSLIQPTAHTGYSPIQATAPYRLQPPWAASLLQATACLGYNLRETKNLLTAIAGYSFPTGCSPRTL